MNLLPRLLGPCLLATAALFSANACSSNVSTGGSGGSGSTTAGTGGGVPCGSQACPADQYCFHEFGGSCTDDTTCSASCPCACGSLPASCPMDMPCSCPGTSPFGGYFGDPGEVFSGPDAGAPYPDHQIDCYGS